MTIDPKEIKSIEDSMVHDLDESPHPEGWGIYLTLRFLSRIIMAAYGVMLLGMISIEVVLREGPVPIFLRREATLLALPIVIVAAYLYLTSEPEPDLSKLRTPLGKALTFIAVFVGLEACAILSWIGLVKAFSLR